MKNIKPIFVLLVMLNYFKRNEDDTCSNDNGCGDVDDHGSVLGDDDGSDDGNDDVIMMVVMMVMTMVVL